MFSFISTVIDPLLLEQCRCPGVN